MATNYRPPDNWFGKVKGHVGERDKLIKTREQQREAEGASDHSVILTDYMLDKGIRFNNAGEVLYATLGKNRRELTSADLAAFKINITAAKKQSGFQRGGITARQVIDLASSSPLEYKTAQPHDALSDIDKARKEITTGVAVSFLNGEIRFITNAGGQTPNVHRHHVMIELLEFNNAATDLTSSDGDKPGALRKAADRMRKGRLRFDCDCDRHRYFLRYVATIGDFNIKGKEETGYPKIRNPGLKGVACKHVLRVMTELESSAIVLHFLEKNLQKTVNKKVNVTLKQADAEEALKRKTPTRIKTSKQREKEAEAARIRRSSSKPTPPPEKVTLATKVINKALKDGVISQKQAENMRNKNLSVVQAKFIIETMKG